MKTKLRKLIEKAKKGCGKEIKDSLMSDENEAYYNICGVTEINEVDGTKHKYLCLNCQAKEVEK